MKRRWSEIPTSAFSLSRSLGPEARGRVRQFPPAGFCAMNLICPSRSFVLGSSVVPAGTPAFDSMKARMSAFCVRLRLPGAFCGIEMRMRSNSRRATGRSSWS